MRQNKPGQIVQLNRGENLHRKYLIQEINYDLYKYSAQLKPLFFEANSHCLNHVLLKDLDVVELSYNDFLHRIIKIADEGVVYCGKVNSLPQIYTTLNLKSEGNYTQTNIYLSIIDDERNERFGYLLI